MDGGAPDGDPTEVVYDGAPDGEPTEAESDGAPHGDPAEAVVDSFAHKGDPEEALDGGASTRDPVQTIGTSWSIHQAVSPRRGSTCSQCKMQVYSPLGKSYATATKTGV